MEIDLQAFRLLVDSTNTDIKNVADDLSALSRYVGLPETGHYSQAAASQALYKKIRDAFGSGHAKARKLCGDLIIDLIRERVILGANFAPYFEVLTHLRDALHPSEGDRAEISGDWAVAVQAAVDHVQVSSFRTTDPERVHARHFEVAKAARDLKKAGYALRLESGWLSMEEQGEKALIRDIEKLVATMGGLNVARRIFSAIAPMYDVKFQRYHLIPDISMTGGGRPQVPWGYLLNLAVKHFSGRKPYEDSDANWVRLTALACAYAAVIDVQPYVPTAFGSFEPLGLLQHIQEMALYDTIFRIPQLRPSDTTRLCRGLLGFRGIDEPTPDGWTLRQALEVIEALFSCSPDIRGPVTIAETDICRASPNSPKSLVAHILENVLCHPAEGANRYYSRPNDAPTPENPESGVDFIFRPLLRLSGRRFLMIDRSVCAAACPEALMSAFRVLGKGFEDKVGIQAERFLEAELIARGIPVSSGDYDVGAEHGECDIVVETPEKVVFIELKKKALTRKARAGSDVDLLLDLTGSLLAAQAQCGWHEERLRRSGRLELTRDGQSYQLNLSGREVERIAIALLDYGSFQDRMFLKHMMETTIGAQFTPIDAKLNKRFISINNALQEIHDQLAALHPGEVRVDVPFFHCWFLSIPQLLVLLDGVTDAASFWEALNQTRHIHMGTSDFYYEFSHVKRIRGK